MPWRKAKSMRARLALKRSALLWCGLGLLTPHAWAAAGPHQARELLRQWYLASGGSHWAPLAQERVRGRLDLGGIRGSFDQIVDLKRGRDVSKVDAGPLKTTEVTLTDSSWAVNQNGVVSYSDSPTAKRAAIDESFEDRNGWFDAPESELTYEGMRRAHGQRYELVTVTPPGGRKMTLWFNARSHLLERVDQLDSTHHGSETVFSDYRKVDGVLTPFSIRQSDGRRSQNVVERVKTVQFSSTVDQAAFVPPPSSFKDARLLGGRSSVTVPFGNTAGFVLIHVSVNGHAAVPFLLDTGGVNYLTPQAARHLGVRGVGNIPLNGTGQKQENARFAKVREVRVGAVEMLHQVFVIGPLPEVLEHRGKKAPIAGLLGPELLQCFPTTFNYQKKTLTFYKPGTVPPEPSGAQAFRLEFDGGQPYMRVSVDGVAGIFGIDTGDSTSTTIFGAFYRAHRFPVEQPALPRREAGIGGVGSALLTRVGSLGFGGWKLEDPLIALNFAPKGAFSSESIAGNLGSKVLREFVFTLDYAHETGYFVRSSEFGKPIPYNRSGMALARTDAGKVVVEHVNPGTPAAKAGIPVGAVILSLNDESQPGESLSAFKRILSGKPGTEVEVHYRWQDDSMYTHFRLGELLPLHGKMKPLSPGSSGK